MSKKVQNKLKRGSKFGQSSLGKNYLFDRFELLSKVSNLWTFLVNFQKFLVSFQAFRGNFWMFLVSF